MLSISRVEVNSQFELNLKYAATFNGKNLRLLKWKILRISLIPKELDFLKVTGLSNEAKEKLNRVQPSNLGQASRISGVSPADISVLMVVIKGKRYSAEKQDSDCC